MIETIVYAFTLTFAARIGWHTAGGLIEFIAAYEDRKAGADDRPEATL